MDVRRIEQAVKDLAKDNFKLYPADYPNRNGVPNGNCATNLLNLANNYFDHRELAEIQQQDHFGVNRTQYAIWIYEAFRDWAVNK